MNKTQKALKKVLYSRAIIFIILLLVQILLIMGTYMFFNKYAVWVANIISFLSISVVIYIINNDDNPMYKLAWIIPVLIFPVFGTILYIYISLRFVTNKIDKKHRDLRKETSVFLKQNEKIKKEIEDNDKLLGTMINYLNKEGYPIYKNTKTNYYKIGEDFFVDLKSDLKKAEKFIFMEYFIVSDNSMWNEILDILKEKVHEGVEVRVMYDGFGSLTTLPPAYEKYLTELGIKCQVFSPLSPILSTYQNNRDHRKITVIDGKIGYTGGLNLSDEYINKVVRHGHWKDNAIRLKGEAVNSLTIIFLQLWDIYAKQNTKHALYLTDYKEKSDGFILPYADNPLDDKTVGEDVYLDMINNAINYVSIVSPYLILDGEMIKALKHAVDRGVDVSIMLPHISDGKGTAEVASSYYLELINGGVKIFEYIPGFVHAKMVLTDDDKAVIGTINFDYRSLYLHFENAVFLYKSSTIKDIKKDIEFIKSESIMITKEEYKNKSLLKRIMGRILRLIAPLM